MPSTFSNDLRRSLAYLRPHAGRIALVLALTLGASSLPAIEPLLHRALFDRLAAQAALRDMLAPVLILGVLTVGRVLLSGAISRRVWRVRLRINRDLLAKATGRLHTLPIGYHQGRGIGETMTRLDRGITSFVDGLAAVAFQLLPAVVYILVALAIMFRLSPLLALTALVFVVPPLFFGRKTTSELVARERAGLERWCSIYNRMQEVLAGIKTVKVFAQESAEHRRFITAVEGAQREVVRSVDLSTRLSTARSLSVNLGRVAVLGAGGVLVLRGQLGVGTLVAFFGYVGGLYEPAQTLLGLYETARRAELGLRTYFDVIDAEDAVPDVPDAHVPRAITGEIAFERVTFRHDRASASAPALHDVSLSITPGELVALVGPSGAGKSTLADLLLRLHDPCTGAVRIDGRDLRELSQIELRRRIGIVTQEPFLFEDTIEENIRYGSPHATADDVRAAACAAQADAFIQRLPHGYATRVGRGGVQLSGGERQRLAIARTLLKDPAIVVLDEPTSALDVESELLVSEAIERLTRGRTTVLVAHRLGTTLRADRVVVLEGGRVAEQGPPSALLQQEGPFSRMMALWQASTALPQL
ncbi:ABC transporter, ATP-binding protein, MsbA family protein [Minicystis rosea]|nr:ABC transporter, ATP-binding protein, MsbA family protein [Minicystis rosea]